jgi:hypothetical protein
MQEKVLISPHAGSSRIDAPPLAPPFSMAERDGSASAAAARATAV